MKTLNITQFPITNINANRRNLEVFIERANNAIEAGECIKAEFNQVKESANRVCETAWSNLPTKNAYRSDCEVSKYFYFEISSTYAHNIPGIIKKANNGKKVNQESEITKGVQAILAELLIVSESLAAIKGTIVTKRKAQVEKETKLSETAKAEASHADTVKVTSFLNEFTSGIREELRLSSEKYLTSVTSRVLAKVVGMTGSEARKEYSGNGLELMVISRLTTTETNFYNAPLVSVPKDEVGQWIDDESTASANQVVSHFVAKVTSKVAGLLVKKNCLKSVSLSGGYYNIRNGIIEAALSFTFTDGSLFTLDSKVEYAYSVNGKLFLRFPSRFSLAIDSNGDKIKSVCEEAMYAEWI